MDKHLTWNNHVLKVGSKISRTIGVMARLKKTLSSQVLKMIYCSLIQSNIMYGLLVWGFNVTKIYVLQKKAIRLIDKAFFLEHTEKLFKKYNLLTITDLFNLRCLNLIFRIFNGTCPSYVSNIVTFDNSNDIVIPMNGSNTTSYQKCLRFYLPIFVRSCPRVILDCIFTKTENSFNHFFKKYFIQNYSDSPCILSNCYSCRLKAGLRQNFNHDS